MSIFVNMEYVKQIVLSHFLHVLNAEMFQKHGNEGD